MLHDSVLYHGRWPAVLFLPLLVCAAASGQPARCTQETIVGTYAAKSQGFISMIPPGASQPVAVPIASLSLGSLDDKGNVAAHGYISVGGQVQSVSDFEGKVKVNSDCTAVMQGPGTTFDLVIHDEGATMEGLVAQFPVGKPIGIGTWKRISRIPSTVDPKQCSEASLHGVYAFNADGIFIVSLPDHTTTPAPFAVNGYNSIGYDGKVTATGAGSLGGQTGSVQITGNVSVQPDCSGTGTFSLAYLGQTSSLQDWFVVLDGGNEVWIMMTEASGMQPIALETWTRNSPIPLTQTQQ